MKAMIKFFQFANLPQNLHGVAGECYGFASSMDALLPESDEKAAGLRKLLEAKDCFLRAAGDSASDRTA